MEKIENLIIRNKSILTGCLLEDMYILENFPIHMMESDDEVCADMIFSIGREDGFIQLKKIIPSDRLYIDTHSNAIGKTWYGAHKAVAQEIKDIATENTRILEIGGGTGRLNIIFNELEGRCKSWHIIEPQPCPVAEVKAEYIKGFFPEIVQNQKFDMIIHTHSIEHMEDINSFMKNLCKCIEDNGILIFSLPDMNYMMKQKVTSIMNFEHTFLLTEEYMDYLLGIYGFEIEKKEHYGNGHSLIYTTKYVGLPSVSQTFTFDLYRKNKKLFSDYIQYHKDMIEEWNMRLAVEQRKCYLFGAHISTQFFVSYGLNMDKISAVLDNDLYKQGKKVSGIRKEVVSPQILREYKDVVVIIPNNPYKNEIKKDIVENINSNVEFWE